MPQEPEGEMEFAVHPATILPILEFVPRDPWLMLFLMVLVFVAVALAIVAGLTRSAVGGDRLLVHSRAVAHRHVYRIRLRHPDGCA